MSLAPHILLTNDDGISSDGINVMRAALVAGGCSVTVIAPDRNRSAISHAATCRGAITLRQELSHDGAVAYACSGTPADCARIGVLAELGSPLDVVVSGINEGINLGDDVAYSGTVSAAAEAAALGVRAIAFSQQGEDGGVPFINVAEHAFDLAPYAVSLVRWVVGAAVPERVMLNVNLPARLASPEPAITRLGRRYIARGVPLERIDHDTFVVRPWGTPEDPEPAFENVAGTDFHAVLAGQVSVTPIMVGGPETGHFEPAERWLTGLPDVEQAFIPAVDRVA